MQPGVTRCGVWSWERRRARTSMPHATSTPREPPSSRCARMTAWARTAFCESTRPNDVASRTGRVLQPGCPFLPPPSSSFPLSLSPPPSPPLPPPLPPSSPPFSPPPPPSSLLSPSPLPPPPLPPSLPLSLSPLLLPPPSFLSSPRCPSPRLPSRPRRSRPLGGACRGWWCFSGRSLSRTRIRCTFIGTWRVVGSFCSRTPAAMWGRSRGRAASLPCRLGSWGSADHPPECFWVRVTRPNRRCITTCGEKAHAPSPGINPLGWRGQTPDQNGTCTDAETTRIAGFRVPGALAGALGFIVLPPNWRIRL